MKLQADKQPLKSHVDKKCIHEDSVGNLYQPFCFRKNEVYKGDYCTNRALLMENVKHCKPVLMKELCA